MPRVARIKSELGIYHIICRSISDVPLFKDSEDKFKYLQLIKKYQNIFLFKVYAYCIMSTHVHLAIDCCGADISKIMHSINQCYASFFNKKYNRHGHVFQDRFKSKLVTDEKYLLTLSAYIHNNPRDIEDYKLEVEKYQFSSLSAYLGISTDTYKILNTHYLLNYFDCNISKARKKYFDFINRISECVASIDSELNNVVSETRTERMLLIRNSSPREIVNSIIKLAHINFNIHTKYIHQNTELKALSVLAMRSLCNFKFKDICNELGNITVSNVQRLCLMGYKLITEDLKYTTLFDNLVLDCCSDKNL
jgi:Transposase and inactivated derivatives